MPTYAGQLGPEPRDPDQAFWDPEMQTIDRDELAELQLRRLRELVDHSDRDPGRRSSVGS
ncbi:MAG: hypothetical protein U5R31_01125 [Acidimicrobiia bacterium]|nr:hypothetical protein [Acidimicrobiia bacterium]